MGEIMPGEKASEETRQKAGSEKREAEEVPSSVGPLPELAVLLVTDVLPLEIGGLDGSDC